MNYVSRQQFLNIINKQSYNDRHRWRYMLVAIKWLREIQPRNVLEAGSRGLILCNDSDTVGLEENEQIKHDLTQVPWPFNNKQYDAFVALQVWEHLGNRQLYAFAEARRTAKHIILSLPYKWPRRGSHGHIDLNKIIQWAGGVTPVKHHVVYKRIVCHWDFSEY